MLAIRFTNAYSDCNSHANANRYWYSFTYTNSNSNCQAVANAENSTHAETAPNSTAETIGFGAFATSTRRHRARESRTG